MRALGEGISSSTQMSGFGDQADEKAFSKIEIKQGNAIFPTRNE